MPIKRLSLMINGEVQGVYYRASTVETARQLGLTGFARNLSDGRVEVVAEGTSDALADLKNWCRKGPPAASVASVDAEESEATREFAGFEIL
jgi:acylphosphatase